LEAQAYKSLVLDTCFGTGPDSFYPRKVLAACAPGDWRLADKFVFWVDDVNTSREDVFQFLLTHLSPLVVGHSPFKYSTKWTGSEKTFRDILLPACLHGMLEHVFSDYMRTAHASEGVVQKLASDALTAEVLALVDDELASCAYADGVHGQSHRNCCVLSRLCVIDCM
jgi:hypothetical protein